MIGVEDQVYGNPLRIVHPRDKIVFTLVTMMLGLLSGITASLAIVVTMGYLTVVRAKVPWQFLLRLYWVPAGFLAIGAISIGLSLSPDVSAALWGISIGSWHLGFTANGLNQAMLLLARSGGAVSCLFFLALTTPLEDINGQLERWGVPYILIEMMTLVYRFIFILWEEAVIIHTAQAARLGHIDIKTSLRSLGCLISSLFIQTIDRTHILYNSLVARGYTDSLRVLGEEHRPTPWPTKLGFIIFDLMLLELLFLKGSGWS